MPGRAEIRWVEASYTAIHHVLSNPVYAGAYVYGKTRQKTILDASGARKKRIRSLPRAEWQVFIPEHHKGFIDALSRCTDLNSTRAPSSALAASSVRPRSPTISVWPFRTNHGSSARVRSVTSSEICSGVWPGVCRTLILTLPSSRKSFSPTECANFFAAAGYEPI
jgi:hypothetical protein